jgi:hypothetical protein
MQSCWSCNVCETVPSPWREKIFDSSDLEKPEVLFQTPKIVIVGLCKCACAKAVLTLRSSNCCIQSVVKARTVNGVALLAAYLLVLMIFSSQRVSVFGK